MIEGEREKQEDETGRHATPKSWDYNFLLLLKAPRPQVSACCPRPEEAMRKSKRPGGWHFWTDAWSSAALRKATSPTVQKCLWVAAGNTLCFLL